LKQKFKKLDELKKKKEAELKLSKSVGKKDGVGKKGGTDVHSVAAAACTDTYRKQYYGDTKANDLVSSFNILYEFTVYLNCKYVCIHLFRIFQLPNKIPRKKKYKVLLLQQVYPVVQSRLIPIK